MIASAHEPEPAIHGMNFQRSFEPLQGENPEAILATAGHGVFTELAWVVGPGATRKKASKPSRTLIGMFDRADTGAGCFSRRSISGKVLQQIDVQQANGVGQPDGDDLFARQARQYPGDGLRRQAEKVGNFRPGHRQVHAMVAR